ALGRCCAIERRPTGCGRPVVQRVGGAGRPDPRRYRGTTRRPQTAPRPPRGPPSRPGRRRDPHRRTRRGRGGSAGRPGPTGGGAAVLVRDPGGGDVWPGRGRRGPRAAAAAGDRQGRPRTSGALRTARGGGTGEMA